jgi:sugar phosphate isomerase/epimerase
MDIFGYLETARYRYHLCTADIWNGLLKNYNEDYLRLVKQHVDERGLTVVNLCCDGCHIWDKTPEDRARNEALAMDCLRAAEILEAKTVRMDVGVWEDEFTDEQFEYVTKKYSAYCKKAAAFGAKLGTENHWGASTYRGNMEKLFDAIPDKNHAMLLHLGNWKDGDPDENDRAMISRAMHMHMNYEHCADADRVIPPLVEAGYTGCWTVESHKGVNEYNNVAFQLAQARRVIAPLRYKMDKEIVTIPEK